MFNRLCAYTVDMLLVMVLTYLVTNTFSLNPYMYDYEEAYDAYEKVYNEIDFQKANSFDILDQMKEPLYNLQKTQLYVYIWYIGIMIFYFVIFQVLNKGQTIGKKMCGLKVVNKEGKDANILRLLIHSIFVGSTFYYGFNLIIMLNILSLLLCSINNYMMFYFLITFMGLICEIVYYIIPFTNKDKKCLNDYIAGVKTISIKKDVILG